MFCRTSCTWRSQLSLKPSRSRRKARPHAAAAVVPADDDVAHFQQIDRKLHDGETIQIGMHDQVGNIAMDE